MSDFAQSRVVPGRESIIVYALAAKSGDTVSVWMNGTTVTVKCARDITPAQYDLLLLERTGMYWTAVCRMGTAAVTPPTTASLPAPDPKPASPSGRSTFSPVETRSFRNGAWRFDTDDVYQGQWGGAGNHTGCAFYGSGVQSLSGATIAGAWIQVHRNGSGGYTSAQPTTLWLVTQATRPGGAPTLTSSTAGPSLGWGGSASFPVPASWVASMAAGTAGGLAVFASSGSPYVILGGRGSYGPSFTLTVDWTR